MEYKYNGLRDPHLNVFYSYGNNAHLENNVTKAFINVLQSLNEKQFKDVVLNLFGFHLPTGKYNCTFYLQKKPREDMVKKYSTRIMFAFSPTGKRWGITGLDTKNERQIRDELLIEAKKISEIEEEQKIFVESSLNEILKVRENKGSIPDGWLFVDVDEKPTLVVAMENKLYDLDPFQLNNHIEKSLYLTQNKPTPVYKKYDDILVQFKKINSFMSNQFIEYMVILNYSKIDDFSLACRADEEIRKKLVIGFGKELLDGVGDEKKDQRNYETVRAYVNYDYLHEINLSFKNERIELWLSFGPTQSSAKLMLSRLDSNVEIKDDHFSHSSQGFHLLYQRGRIINGLYVYNWKINEYVDYWKKNIDLIKTSTPEEAIDLYKKMYEDGIIDKELLNKAIDRLSGKKNPILIVPEISLVFAWDYEEAAELGVNILKSMIKEKIAIALKAMHLIVK